MKKQNDTDIKAEDVTTLCDLFARRTALAGAKTAYRQYDSSNGQWREWKWREIADEVRRWQRALAAEGLAAGCRVAVMLPNGVNWILCDQAVLGSGLVLVPLFSHDNAGNVEHVLRDSGAEVLVTDGPRFDVIAGIASLSALKRIVLIGAAPPPDLPNAVALDDWIAGGHDPAPCAVSSGDLATLIYTSGTTGPAKGVALTHDNILANVIAVRKSFPMGADNLFLSFLPLSHIFERTAGYYLSMLLGAEVAFARSVLQLREDMAAVKPTAMLAVPRVYDGIYEKLIASIESAPAFIRRAFALLSDPERAQEAGGFEVIRSQLLLDLLVGRRIRRVFGGRMRYALSGGAALSAKVARTFIMLGVPVYQGYGLTETSPVVAVNRQNDNVPGSIGPPIDGVEVKIGDNDELLTRSRYVMQGYWNLPEANAQAIDADGWFHTGDQARMDDQGRLYISGRIKEIIVMSNGEKIPPVDMENALVTDAMFSQAMVYGEGRSYLIALLVLNPDELARCLRDNGAAGDDGALDREPLKSELMKRVSEKLAGFPSYAKVRRVIALREPWTIENEMLTPTMKLKRRPIVERHRERIEAVYRSL